MMSTKRTQAAISEAATKEFEAMSEFLLNLPDTDDKHYCRQHCGHSITTLRASLNYALSSQHLTAPSFYFLSTPGNGLRHTSMKLMVLPYMKN